MPAEIRPARQSDIAAMFHIRTSVRENHLSLERLAKMGITEVSISDMMTASPCSWVAIVDGEIVGFSMIDLNDASLFAAFVLPSHEGMGVGKGLVTTAENMLFERHSEIWLETDGNTRAAGFYRHLGWTNDRELNERDIRLTKLRP